MIIFGFIVAYLLADLYFTLKVQKKIQALEAKSVAQETWNLQMYEYLSAQKPQADFVKPAHTYGTYGESRWDGNGDWK